MKAFLIILASLSLLLNAYFFIREIDAASGGGQHKQSPDKQRTVMMNSKRNANPLSPEKEVYAEISLHDGFIADKRIRTFIVSPISETHDMAYRELEDPIQWSEDSQEVTVTTPDFTLSINLGTKPTELQR